MNLHSNNIAHTLLTVYTRCAQPKALGPDAAYCAIFCGPLAVLTRQKNICAYADFYEFMGKKQCNAVITSVSSCYQAKKYVSS